MTIRAAASLALVLPLLACSSGADAEAQVLSTTTVLGSVTDQVARCAGGESQTLMGAGDDPHDFSPSSRQVVAMTKADVVVANGLGLEGGLADALDSARSDGARVLEVAPEVQPLPMGGSGDHEHEHGDHEHEGHEHEDEGEGDDPHFWLDVGRMARAAQAIGAEAADATGDRDWARCGDETAQDLRDTDREVRRILASVPDSRRVLVTDHDAFGYFADAYDFRVAGVVIPGGSTDAEPSSEQLAAVVDVVRREDVSALFSNTAVSSELVDAVAGEVGRDVQVVPLYVGSVGEAGSPAEDYAGMMTANATAVADALR